MTVKPFLNKQPSAPSFTRRYFLYSIKSSWSISVLFFIVFLFVLTVPTLMRLNNMYYLENMFDKREQILTFIDSNRIFFFLVSACCSLFAGCKSLSFLQNKTSATFYHSLPERRSGHYIAALSSAVLPYVFSVLIHFVLVLLSYAMSGYLDSEIFKMLLFMIFVGFIYFLTFLSIVFLAGMITGISGMQVLTSLYITLILPVLYFSVDHLIDSGTSYLQTIAYSLDTPMVWLSPMLRLVTICAEGYAESLKYIIFDSFAAAAFFIGSYMIYKMRPIEKTGTPIVFYPLSQVIKYSIMFPSAVLLGYIFHELAGGIWQIFGFAAGALLSYMLCNTVFNRSAKAMFSEFRGLCIFSAAFVFSLIFFFTGFFGSIDYLVPQASQITVNVNQETYVLSDKEDIAEFRAAAEKFTGALKSGETDCFSNTDTQSRLLYLRIEYRSPVGMTFEYYYPAADYEYTREMLGIVRESIENFNIGIESAYMNISIPSPIINNVIGEKEGEGQIIDASITYSLPYYIVDDSSILLNIEYDMFFPIGADDFQSLSIGYLNLSAVTDTNGNDNRYEYNYYTMPLYLNKLSNILNTMGDYTIYELSSHVYNGYTGDNIKGSEESEFNELLTKEISSISPEEFIDMTVKSIDSIEVLNTKTGKSIRIRDRDVMKETLSCVASIGSSAEISPLTDTEADYYITIYDSYSNECNSTRFLRGKIPSIISDILK